MWGGVSQIDISSVWFEGLTNDGSMRTIKPKLYLNSLSLLTASRFIYHSRRERLSQTLLVRTQVKFLTSPELSRFQQRGLTVLFVSLSVCTLTVERHWPHAALITCWLLAFRSFSCPWLQQGWQPDGEAEQGTSSFLLWCLRLLLGKREDWGHWCCPDCSWRRRALRGWIMCFPISVSPCAISTL